MGRPYNPEKIVVEFAGKKKILRMEKSFCNQCGEYQPHVFLKPDFWPTESLLAHDELKHTLHVCLECGASVHGKQQITRLHCFDGLRVSLPEAEKRAVSTADNPLLAT